MWRLCVVVALVAVLSGCGTDEYLLGRDLYDRSCAACHGIDGRGGSLGSEIGVDSNTDLNLSDDQIAGVITVGPGNMPGFSRLTAEQVASLVDYVRLLSD